ncbi:MAG: class I SAM-dependent methyltransferase [Planctomycetes bacterium]|nr:class I SAM-dependent methyltransferase [Planctomycetota bacterium]
MGELYDAIGRGYAGRRRPEPRIAAAVRTALGDVRDLVNVGAGTGSYEPDDLPVVAVEPSRTMIGQRRSSNPIVQARAEELPFRDRSFDASMAVLTVHHWGDPAVGLAECARAARRCCVALSWDPAAAGFWLVEDYVPELLAYDRAVFPPLAAFERAWGRIDVVPVPVPADCRDGFLGAYWRRPEAYLEPTVRAAISSFARVGDVEARMERLRADLASGAWDRRRGGLRSATELDLGYRLVVAKW